MGKFDAFKRREGDDNAAPTTLAASMAARIASSTRSAADAARATDLSTAIGTARTVTGAAAQEAKLTNKHGEVSKWRLARAAARPTTTGRRLATGVAKGLADSAGTSVRESAASEPAAGTIDDGVSRGIAPPQ